MPQSINQLSIFCCQKFPLAIRALRQITWAKIA